MLVYDSEMCDSDHTTKLRVLNLTLFSSASSYVTSVSLGTSYFFVLCVRKIICRVFCLHICIVYVCANGVRGFLLFEIFI